MNTLHNQLSEELIAIDNRKDTMTAAFNISDERIKEIMNTLQTKAGERFAHESKSEYSSRALYACNPRSILEVFTIGQAIGHVMA